MAGQTNAAPVIIRRKTVVVGRGHRGGAWKVAYADFVTALMAFFMLMWLLSATTEKQRKGIADFFNPTVAVNRISGGGDGAFGGDAIFSELTLAQSGTGASSKKPTEQNAARGTTAGDAADMAAAHEKVQAALLARGGESMTMKQALRHVVTKVTDEGLVIELFDLPEAALFVGTTAEPAPVTHDIVAMVASVLDLTSNEVAINGHVNAVPIILIDNPVWDVSSARAEVLRNLLVENGLDRNRPQRVSGFADRKPVTPDPTADRNNRIEIILLRSDR